MTSERRKQRRAASLKRRRHVREPERRFHIYCEGTKTEPAYFKALRSQFSRVQLEVIPVGGDPMQVASKAIEHRRRSRRDRQSSFEETDQVWAVFDRDRHTTHAAALDACRRAGVHVASSDPCFELWLALHFEPYDKPAHSVQIQRRLHHLFPSYNHDKAETGIVGHRLREVTLDESSRQLMSKLAELGVKTPPERMDVLELAHRRSDGEDVYFELERESAGTRRLVVVLTQAFDALDSGTLLVVDELDAGLHTAAAQAVLDLFCARQTNPNGAQLIATTHDTNLLAASNLRRDQVWFAKKTRDGATRTYPLTDIRTRKGDNLERGYLQRRYGAAPRRISPSDQAVALEA